MRKRLVQILKIICWVAISGLIVLATFIATLYLGGFGKIPSEQELVRLKNENASLILSEEGKIIGKFFNENRTDITYDSLPQHLIQALVATEDARFYEHKGIDSRAMIRVLLKTIILGDKSAGGGSTLSQQLAKNLFGRKNYGKVSIPVNKLKEIILANRLENIYSKEEIIELYFNTVPFGENVYGVEVASKRFFSVSSSQLKVEQSAVLVGMLKANTYYNPRLNAGHALSRRAVVFSQMNHMGYLSESELDSLNRLKLGLKYSNVSVNNESAYFSKQVEDELKVILAEINKTKKKGIDYKKDGLRINTTLNYNLQKSGLTAMRKHLMKMQKLLDKQFKSGSSQRTLSQLAEKVARRKKLKLDDRSTISYSLFDWEEIIENKGTVKDSLMHVLRQLHAGFLALNPQNGAVKSWIGGIDFSFYPYDQVLAKRQLASTFKPILYTEALRSGKSACDYLSNDAIVLNDYDDWSPQNYDGESGGYYSLAAGLAYSKNLPAVHLYFDTDHDQLAQLWSDLGFIEKLNEGPSVILGTNSVSMLELATAYGAFANGGYTVDPYIIESIEDENGNIIYTKSEADRKKILEQEITDELNEILIKAINEGTGAAMRSTYEVNIPLAGKTGTSQDYSDAWFVCYNKELVLVSRVGASYPVIHFNNGGYGSGGRLALPLAGLTLKEALKDATFEKSQRNASLSSSDMIDCEDFKDANLIDDLFKLFKKKETSLDKERKRSKRKKKVKNLFKSVFGEKEK